MTGMQLPRSKLYIAAFILFLVLIGFQAYLIYTLWYDFLVMILIDNGDVIGFLVALQSIVLAPLEGVGLGYFVKFKVPAYKSFEKGVNQGLVERSSKSILKLGS